MWEKNHCSKENILLNLALGDHEAYSVNMSQSLSLICLTILKCEVL